MTDQDTDGAAAPGGEGAGGGGGGADGVGGADVLPPRKRRRPAGREEEEGGDDASTAGGAAGGTAAEAGAGTGSTRATTRGATTTAAAARSLPESLAESTAACLFRSDGGGAARDGDGGDGGGAGEEGGGPAAPPPAEPAAAASSVPSGSSERDRGSAAGAPSAGAVRPSPTARLKLSSSALSLALTASPLLTPRDEEAVTPALPRKLAAEVVAIPMGLDVLGDAAADDSPAGRKGSSSVEGGRKRKQSVEEDILMGSRNSSTHSLPEETPSPEPAAKRPRVDADAGGVDESREGGEEKKDDDESDETSTVEKRHKPAIWSARCNLAKKGPSSAAASTYDTESHPRWRSHRAAEDYVSLASAVVLPPTHLGPFGYSPAAGRYPLERATALGYLTSPLRRPTVVEKWNPYEIATFEAALAVCGKRFHQVRKWVRTKSTKEIVEFYYVWKKTSHGRRWKGSYEEEDDDGDASDEGGETGTTTTSGGGAGGAGGRGRAGGGGAEGSSPAKGR
ncbi:hypothetical protein ACHAWF_018731 [Thalassiosira exigua]